MIKEHSSEIEIAVKGMLYTRPMTSYSLLFSFAIALYSILSNVAPSVAHDRKHSQQRRYRHYFSVLLRLLHYLLAFHV